MDHKTQRSVTAELNGTAYQTHITARQHTLLADEPADHGGTDLGMRPHELLLAALSSCTAITLRMYADRKGWDTGGITVNAVLDRTQSGRNVESNIRLELRFGKELPPEQRERLLQIANACPVHRTLLNPMNISTEVFA